MARLAVSALSAAAGVLALYLLSSWTAEKDGSAYAGKDNLSARTAALDACKADIAGYLSENKSTPFFRENLNTVAERIDTFSSRCDNIKKVITRRFGSAGLSYGKFSAPVEALREYLTSLTNSLILRMRLFDESEYSIRIDEFTKTNRADKAAGYREVEQEHKDYAENTLAAFDEAILKLDRLALGISKLGEADIEKAMNIMHDLDDVIKDTQFYK
jgi:hypothetical protein